MRTVTITKTLYRFNELSEKAQARVFSQYRDYPDHWHWQAEYWNSARAFSKIAPLTIDEADYTNRYVRTTWKDHYDLADLSGRRAWVWLHNNGWFDSTAKNVRGDCTLTGYIGDGALFDPIHDVARTPAAIRSLRDLFESCAEAWVKEAADDYDYAYSDEAILEFIDANDCEYDEYGNAA